MFIPRLDAERSIYKSTGHYRLSLKTMPTNSVSLSLNVTLPPSFIGKQPTYTPPNYWLCPDHSPTWCDTGCTDTKTDPHNCGRCGNRCVVGENCLNGNCTDPRCPQGG